jgi:hypothetical protein
MDPNGAAEIAQTTAAIAAVSRLIYLNLARQFPALLAYLAFLAAIDLGFGIQDDRSRGYFWTYIAVEPVVCTLGILAVRELLAVTFSKYPGIRTFGRWTMYAAIVVSFAISLSVTGHFWRRGAAGRANSPYIYYVEISKRSVFFALAVVIVFVLIFLSRYPLHLGRNVLVSSLFFSALLLSEAGRLLIDTLTMLANRPVDWAEAGFIFICLVGWTACLRRETAKTPPQVHYTTAREDHLLRQLNSLNDLMARAARR